MQRYDAIIIGSGQGGNPLASALSEAKLRTALIERADVGGTCINYGCTPTKTMVASAEMAYTARRSADYGVHTGPVAVDMHRVRERKREIVKSFRGGSEKRLQRSENVELIRGEARFTGSKTLDVKLNAGSSTELSADLIFIDAGTSPAKPQLPGLDEIAYLDSTSIMEVDSVPDHLVVLGGGYIGLEFGQMFRRFGSRVTIVNRSAQVLRGEDQDVSDEIVKILREESIEVLLDTRADHVTKNASGFVLQVSGAHSSAIEGSHLLVAVGRSPNTGALNLPATGVEVDKQGFIKVNENLETSTPGIYALGDIKGGPAFTHISYDDYRIVKSIILDKKPASIAGRLVPYTVFIDPQLGRIGQTEAEALKSGKKIQVAKMPMSSVARALEVDDTRGFLKAVVDADSQQILGAAALGMQGGESATMFQIAMMGRLPYTALRDGVFSHPTLSEALNNLFFKLEDR